MTKINIEIEEKKGRVQVKSVHENLEATPDEMMLGEMLVEAVNLAIRMIGEDVQGYRMSVN